jgi:hypothetical protein
MSHMHPDLQQALNDHVYHLSRDRVRLGDLSPDDRLVDARETASGQHIRVGVQVCRTLGLIADK